MSYYPDNFRGYLMPCCGEDRCICDICIECNINLGIDTEKICNECHCCQDCCKCENEVLV